MAVWPCVLGGAGRGSGRDSAAHPVDTNGPGTLRCVLLQQGKAAASQDVAPASQSSLQSSVPATLRGQGHLHLNQGWESRAASSPGPHEPVALDGVSGFHGRTPSQRPTAGAA